MIKNANELQEFINSVRKKAFEDVATLIKSDVVTKGDYDLLMIDAEDLINLILAIDAAKLKQQRAEINKQDGLGSETDNLA